MKFVIALFLLFSFVLSEAMLQKAMKALEYYTAIDKIGQKDLLLTYVPQAHYFVDFLEEDNLKSIDLYDIKLVLGTALTNDVIHLKQILQEGLGIGSPARNNLNELFSWILTGSNKRLLKKLEKLSLSELIEYIVEMLGKQAKYNNIKSKVRKAIQNFIKSYERSETLKWMGLSREYTLKEVLNELDIPTLIRETARFLKGIEFTRVENYRYQSHLLNLDKFLADSIRANTDYQKTTVRILMNIGIKASSESALKKTALQAACDFIINIASLLDGYLPILYESLSSTVIEGSKLITDHSKIQAKIKEIKNDIRKAKTGLLWGSRITSHFNPLKFLMPYIREFAVVDISICWKRMLYLIDQYILTDEWINFKSF